MRRGQSVELTKGGAESSWAQVVKTAFPLVFLRLVLSLPLLLLLEDHIDARGVFLIRKQLTILPSFKAFRDPLLPTLSCHWVWSNTDVSLAPLKQASFSYFFLCWTPLTEDTFSSPGVWRSGPECDAAVGSTFPWNPLKIYVNVEICLNNSQVYLTRKELV